MISLLKGNREAYLAVAVNPLLYGLYSIIIYKMNASRNFSGELGINKGIL